jgi:hypothetical protein
VEPRAVAPEHLVISQQVVPERHRLCGLQVGEAGHDAVGVFRRGSDKRPLQRFQPGVSLVDRVPHPQLEVGRHLIVAAARGVQATGPFADQLGEAALGGHVDVLEVPVLRHPVPLVFGGDPVEPLRDRHRVLARNDAAGAEHRDMSLARRYVLAPECLVEGDRGVNLAHDRSGPFGEAPAPHLVGAWYAPFALAVAHAADRPADGRLR